MLLKRFFKKYSIGFFIGLTVLIMETMLDLVQPLYISRIIDEGIMMSDLDKVIQLGLTMVGLAGLQLTFGFFRNYMSTHVSFSYARDIRQSLYEHMLKLEILQIEEVERGSMINRLTYDIRQVQMLVNGSMRFFIRVPLFAIGGLIMVTGLGRGFVWMYLSSIPIVAIILFINLKFGFPKVKKIQKQLDGLNKKTIEYLNGIRVVKAFNRTDYENAQFESVNDNLTDVSVDAGVFMSVFNPAIALTVNMAVIVGIYLSGQWIEAGTAGVGQVVAFINYMARLIMAMSFMARVFNMYIRGITSARRVEEIFNLPVTRESGEIEIAEDDIDQGISFESVSYKYGDGEYALEDISFGIKAGEKLGIIGSTGSGKSTLIHLLVGLLQPTKGAIKIGQKNLTAHTVRSFRNYLGFVPQDKIIFSKTIGENIVFNQDNDISDAQGLEQAMSVAAVDYIEDMEHGIETRLGKGGVNISGGQKQRLSLARALYKKPKCLVLDDCTSALDAMTEKAVFDGLKNHAKPVLTIMISQKISSVRQMDKIMVLSNGRIVGLDTHDVLLSTCQPYQELYKAQMGGH